jgi:methyl-accepting chemotaxis protein
MADGSIIEKEYRPRDIEHCVYGSGEFNIHDLEGVYARFEIGLQVSGIQTATRDSVAAIKEIGGTIERMSEIASSIASAVEEQGSATNEISRNVQHVAQAARQVLSRHHRRTAWRKRDGLGLIGRALGSAAAVQRQQSA